MTKVKPIPINKIEEISDLKLGGSNMSVKIELCESENVFVTVANEGIYSMHMAVKTTTKENKLLSEQFNNEYSMCNSDAVNEAIDFLRKHYLFGKKQDVENEPAEATKYIKAKEDKIYTIGDIDLGRTTDFDFGIMRMAVDFDAADSLFMYAPDEDIDVQHIGEELYALIEDSFDEELNAEYFGEKFKEFQYAIRRRRMQIESPEKEPKEPIKKQSKQKQEAKELNKNNEVLKKSKEKPKQESIIEQSFLYEQESKANDIGKAVISLVNHMSVREPEKKDYLKDKNFVDAVEKIVKHTLSNAFNG